MHGHNRNTVDVIILALTLKGLVSTNASYSRALQWRAAAKSRVVAHGVPDHKMHSIVLVI